MKTSELTGSALDWAVAKCEGAVGMNDRLAWYTPSTDWAQGGAIIEQWISDLYQRGDWHASIQLQGDQYVEAFGDTPLIAAMRCYVASKLGDDVEIPAELVEVAV